MEGESLVSWRLAELRSCRLDLLTVPYVDQKQKVVFVALIPLAAETKRFAPSERSLLTFPER